LAPSSSFFAVWESRKPTRVGKLNKNNRMSQMINKGGELIRICPKQASRIEYSSNEGRTWQVRFSGTGSSSGDFLDLTDNGKEILGTTTKGLYYSTNKGKIWMKRG
jgi:hypothetical protein